MQPFSPQEYGMVGAWLWDAFGKEFVEKSFRTVKSIATREWQKFEWKSAAKLYRNRVYELYSTMRMLGNPAPVSVEGIFTNIYLHDKPQALRRFDIERLRLERTQGSTSQQGGIRIDALEAIKKHDRLFILGKPGAGKTTLMKYVTLLAAKGKIDRVPIFVSLHDWVQTGFELMKYMEKQFEICGFPDAGVFLRDIILKPDKDTIAKEGRAIVLFDGLDEVSATDDKRLKITQQIEDFSNQYQNNKYLITCRVSAKEYSFEKFTYVEIADFSSSQIEMYVRNWFANQPQKVDQFFDGIYKDENHGLRELAQTPILLNLLCLNFDETMYFPSRLVDLYQEALDALLKKWDSSRNIKRDEVYRALSVTRKQQLLARIAKEYFDRKEIFFSENDLVRIVDTYLRTLPGFQNEVDGETILKAIEAQHGVLVERAHRIHSFSHLTFQEYFVAKFIIENGSNNILFELMEHLPDRYWHEVFLMVVSLLPYADGFFEAMALSLQENMGYSFPIRLSRFLKSMNGYSPVKRLIYLYISLAYKLDFYEEVLDIKNRIDAIPVNSNNIELVSVTKSLSQIAGNLLMLKRFLDNKEIPYDCLDALISMIPPLSYFTDNGVIPAGKLKIEKMISSIDDIDLKIKSNLNKAHKIILDTLSVAEKIYKDSNLQGGERGEKYQKFYKLHIELKKVIDLTIKSLSKIEEVTGTTFAKEGAYLTLSPDENSELLSYLYVQKLLLECLKVASVTDREKLLVDMFLQ